MFCHLRRLRRRTVGAIECRVEPYSAAFSRRAETAFMEVTCILVRCRVVAAPVAQPSSP